MQIGNFTAFLLIFIRMGAMFGFNPIFSRNNIPRRFLTGFVLILSMLIMPTIDINTIVDYTDFDFLFAVSREIFVGFVFGFTFRIFYYMIFFVGDVLDMQFGLSMAKVFDPGTNIQMSVTGNIFQIMFILYFFATGSHYLFIKMISTSYQIVAIGAQGVTLDASKFILELFIAVFMMIIRLGLPFAVAAFTLEVSMGILMKLIPQIHVFVINIQFKLLLGIFLLAAFVSPVSAFIGNYTTIMFENLQRALYVLVG